MTFGEFELAHEVADWLGAVAMAIISAAVLIAIVSAVVMALLRDFNGAFEVFKRRMGRGLLIGLDILIAADIVETVTLEPTVENISALGLLVVIRTFLSWAIFLEIEERWPWQPRPDTIRPLVRVPISNSLARPRGRTTTPNRRNSRNRPILTTAGYRWERCSAVVGDLGR